MKPKHLKIYGHSDDLVELDGGPFTDEWPAVNLLMDIGGGISRRVRIVAHVEAMS